MALNLICAVLDRGPDDLSEMAVLLAIADSADKDTGEAWPSQATIAQRARQTDRSVRNVIGRLVAGGWLTVEERKRPNGSRASSLYTVQLEKLGEARTPRAASEKRIPARNPVPGRTGTPFRGVSEPRSGYAPEPRSALEPSHHIEPSGSADFSNLSGWQKKALREAKTVQVGQTQYAAGTEDLARLSESFLAWERALQ